MILIITISIQLLSYFESWDPVGSELSALVTSTENPGLKWPTPVFLLPAILLILSAVLISSVQMYEFTKATRASGFWASAVPTILLFLALATVVVILVFGIKGSSAGYTAMVAIFVVFLVLALLTN